MIKLFLVGLAWFSHSLQFALCASELLKSRRASAYESLLYQLAAGGIGALVVLLATSFARRRAIWQCTTDAELLKATILPAGTYALTVWSTNAALQGTSIGLTFIIKAVEPLFAVVLVVLLVGIYPTSKELLAVFVAVAGCVVTVASNLEVEWMAVAFAFASNLFQQLRNILGKRSMTIPSLMDSGLSKGEVSLLLVMLWSFGGVLLSLALTPALLYLNPEPAFVTHESPIHKAHSTHMVQWMAIHFSTYQICSILVLSAVTPVMHSLANSLKRGIIIFGSALALGLAISTQQGVGITITLVGVYCYSLWKQAPAPTTLSKSPQKTDLGPWWLVITTVALSLISGIAVQPHAPLPGSFQAGQVNVTKFHAAHHRQHTQLQTDETFEPHFFIVLADPQLGLYHANEKWQEELDMVKASVEHINRLKPAYVVIAGDLAHCQPSNNADVRRRQVADLQAALAKVDNSIPLVFVSGNHDLGNRVTRASLRQYHADFGDDFFRFSIKGTQGFVLNTQFFEDAGECKVEAATQRAWFEEALADSTLARHRFVFGHIPPFIYQPDEDDGYFNMEPGLRTDLLKLAKEGGVSAWFAGHYHREAGGRDENMEMITTSSVGSALSDTGLDPLGKESCGPPQVGVEVSGLRVVVVKADSIEHQFYVLGMVPAKVHV
eukprot:m.19575 g.19575  ORF g.19575 m.19575 type:complete len:665 (+) comp10928_c0_seq1:182-2176(+)